MNKYDIASDDHFLLLNLLTFGITTDSNLFPTELFVDPVSPTVSVFPVNTFYLPILNATQLSFLRSLSYLRAGLLLVKRGESHEG